MDRLQLQSQHPAHLAAGLTWSSPATRKSGLVAAQQLAAHTTSASRASSAPSSENTVAARHAAGTDQEKLARSPRHRAPSS